MNDTQRHDMMSQIQALSFAKVESELFLDTHPECAAALKYHREVTEKLDKLLGEYSAKYTPITAGENMTDRWEWARGAWPWHKDWEE